jgi:hypothetical protein
MEPNPYEAPRESRSAQSIGRIAVRAAFKYALRYWWNVVWVAGGNAFAAIGWNHPRNAFLPVIVAIAAAALVGYEQHDLNGFATRAMIAVAGFLTFIAFGVLAFIWQMVATPPRLDAQKALEHKKDYDSLKEEISGLSRAIAGVSASPSSPSEQERKAAHARNTLTQHAGKGDGIEIKGDMVGWMNAADSLVKGLAPRHSGKLWRGYPSGSDPDEILSAGEIDNLQRSIASLHVIVGAITEADYAG